ncbi:iron-sulfur cluster assembly scaffold protein [Mycoplasma mycoides]|uniref:Iron-sulfur cluster assembly scaffold protein n=1 Tax=Mycoplasma mycoides subsp. capri TaxID=40477 RepID=A0AB38GEJ4_MYCMC|nr:iron-sulfur cluster assembly scaffold protein [Mycoplasma mycoides]ADH22045.1 nitrogen fixation protein nifu [synthetic Mycoplasma mycoides JCVI-syn1.0]AMW76517.1 iscU: Iron-sulfur cluster assembly scaffold protein [synthetic bacterium JCVI-Syn3.0]AMW76981.1 iscU: Iron-sulfur cluster assembly scaffold protein [synthetic bacterium JCVI-Syn2.0]AVX54803.1 Iron-sulfur cluster assembly scaffold protein [synthetic bacterium JCVI-Syn3A]QWN46042.1 iron-sulfur cluster assembly scaffold protein [synt
MIDINNDSLLREIIIKHFLNPENKTLTNNKNAIIKELKSQTCADQLIIEILIENKIIKSMKFDGSACAIATSSIDLLINNLLNLDIKKAIELIKNYQIFLLTGTLINADQLNELVVMKNIHKQKNRILCASLALNDLLEILNSYE